MIVDSIVMERDTGISCSNEKRPVEGCKTVRETKTHSENSANAPVFINHGESLPVSSGQKLEYKVCH